MEILMKLEKEEITIVKEEFAHNLAKLEADRDLQINGIKIKYEEKRTKKKQALELLESAAKSRKLAEEEVKAAAELQESAAKKRKLAEEEVKAAAELQESAAKKRKLAEEEVKEAAALEVDLDSDCAFPA